MKDAAYNWAKLLLENWKIVIAILTFLGSLLGNGILAASNTEKDETILLTQKQVATVAEHYSTNLQPKIVKSDCNCTKYIKAHITEFH